MLNKPLKFVPATKSVASTGLANARRLAGRYAASMRPRKLKAKVAEKGYPSRG